MSAIPHAAKALTSASDRLEHASAQLLGAVNGVAPSGEAEAALVELIFAKAQSRAAVAVIRLSDEMHRTLLDIASRTER